MTNAYKNPYIVLAAAAVFASLLMLTGGIALAREAESGGGSSSSSGGSSSSDDSVSVSNSSSVGGVDLRGDGTVDDNLPRRSGLDDVVGGVKLRGDGTVDDNSTGLFRNDLRVGIRNDDVIRLQNELRAGGLFSEQPTGFFGQQTREAVLKFQRERGLPETGLVGRQTREELNRRIEARFEDSSGPSDSSGPGSGPNVQNEDRPTVARPLMVRMGSAIGNFFSRFARIFGF